MSNYLDYLEESTSVVKSRKRLSELILIITYFTIWAFALIVFWFFTSGSDAFGYSLMFLLILLPVTTLVISILIGKNDYWGKYKWVTPIAFGVMYMLAEYATFSAANMASFDKINRPDFAMILGGAIISSVGLGIGTAIRRHGVKSSSR